MKLGELINENGKSKIQVNSAKEINGKYPFFTSGENIFSYNEYLVDGENIFMSTGGNAVVKFYDGKAAYSTDTYVIKSIDEKKLLTKFLYFYLENKQDYINTFLFKGAGLKHLQKNDFRQENIPLPPLVIQQQIADECSKIDAEYHTAKEQIENCRKEIEGIMQGTKGEMRKLGEVCGISRGASPRPINNFLTESDDGVNWIKIGDVGTDAKYITQTQQRITQEGASKSKKVYPGDFIISNSMSVGRPYILKIEGCIHDGWLLISDLDKSINKDYFYYALMTSAVQEQFTDNARGGVVQNLNTSRVSTISILVPPLSEQKKIVAKIEKIEQQIAAANSVMESCPQRKREVLDRRL